MHVRIEAVRVRQYGMNYRFTDWEHLISVLPYTGHKGLQNTLVTRRL